MLDKLSFGRLVSNAAALVVLTIAAASGLDFLADWMGYHAALACSVIPELVRFAWTAAVVMTFAGAVTYLITLGTFGAGLFVAGLVVGAMPTLVNGYLVRLAGIGCNV